MGGDEGDETEKRWWWVKQKKKLTKERDKRGGGGGVENGEMKSEKGSEGEMIQTFPPAEIQGAEER